VTVIPLRVVYFVERIGDRKTGDGTSATEPEPVETM
jgi:hypothetical protein